MALVKSNYSSVRVHVCSLSSASNGDNWTLLDFVVCSCKLSYLYPLFVFKDGVVMRSSGKYTQIGYRSSLVQCDKLCYGGFLVIARDSKLGSLKQPEEEEDMKEDRSRMVPL